MALESTALGADLLQEGNAAYMAGDLEGARASYGRCVESGEWPTTCDCCVNLGSVCLDLGEEAEAERLYRRALAEAASGERGYLHVDAAQNLGSLLQGLGGLERTREAADLYRDVVRADESRWDAWANLGSALVDGGAPKLDAIKCFQRGIFKAEDVERDAESPRPLVEGVRSSLAQMYYGLGACLADLGRDERLSAYRDGEVLLTAYDEAVDLYDGSQEDADAAIGETAANALRAAIQLSGGAFPLAEHALDTLAARDDGTAAPGRASPAFVKALFDDFAPTFDAQLVDGLAYRAPVLLAEAAGQRAALRRAPYGNALDAGCGTGLLGVPLRRHVAGALVGADLSDNMVARAKEVKGDDGSTPIYDGLAVGDLNDGALYDGPGVVASTAPYDLVAAADVLCYFGDLDTVLALWADCLAPGGDVVFSCERVDDDADGDAPWKLGPSGRYAHRPSYVARVGAAAGLELLSATDIVPRVENGNDVPGTLYVFTKPRQ